MVQKQRRASVSRVMTTVGGGKAHASALQHARKEAHVSQRTAAHHVGIIVPLLNEAEHDLATLPPEIVEKLYALYKQDDFTIAVCSHCGHIAKAGARCAHCGKA
jgi:DNA-binding XRE family transcriptional regulator